MITDSPGVRLRESVVAQVMDGQMVLLDVNGGQYYDLNASGTLMLERLLAGATREQVIAAVEDKFLASSERVAADLDALVLTLRQAGLIEG
ncbi:MAG TPA: PqqD family peptide modification chaperone [Xanthomonadales bacterium]|nr:PqqD family peptide modification chaperone [Xanthomonadales bacterium]